MIMNRKEYMMPSMMVVKLQAANQLLSVSHELGLHNEVSSNNSYVKKDRWSNDASCTPKNIWSDEWQ